jgi:phosphate-selective porin OprO/OprP
MGEEMAVFTTLKRSVWITLLLVLPAARAQQPPVAPQSVADLEKRVRELEEIVRRLQAERAPSRPAEPIPAPAAGAMLHGVQIPESTEVEGPSSSPPGGPSPGGVPYGSSGGGEGKSSPLAGWNDKDKYFYLRSADNRFNLRFTGQIQTDYRAFLDGTDYTDIDTFIVRRARLGIEATLFNYYEFRLLPDFSNAQAPGLPGQTRIQDAYINVHYWDCFQVEAGKFKQPFSYEQLIQDRYVPTLERSLIDQLVPARDEGVMVHGQKLLDDRLDYAFSVANGEINGDFDTEDRKDVNGRIAVRPFNCAEFWPALHGLQVGISGTYGVEQEPIMPNTLRTPATVPWFQFNSTVRADGFRWRMSPELVYFNGPFGFATQYLREEQRMRPTFSGPGSQFLLQVPFDGWYVLATLLLTGEERTTYSEVIDPLRPFDPCHSLNGPGAWELVARVSHLRLGDDVFQPLPTGRTTFITLADPTRFSNEATEMTLGFNWYMNRWVRMQFNWEHAWFEDPVRLGPGPNGLLSHQDTLLTRLQIIF